MISSDKQDTLNVLIVLGVLLIVLTPLVGAAWGGMALLETMVKWELTIAVGLVGSLFITGVLFALFVKE